MDNSTSESKEESFSEYEDEIIYQLSKGKSKLKEEFYFPHLTLWSISYAFHKLHLPASLETITRIKMLE